MSMTTQLWLLSSIATTAWVAYLILRKDSLAQFDQPAGQLFKLNTKAAQAESVKALKAINQRLRGNAANSTKMSMRERLPIMRESMDTFFASGEVDCVSDFIAVDAGGVPAEWVTAPGVDANNSRRLLYIHGGAFMAGSPKSHRVITSKLSEITDCTVLSIDYRLMPEHSRMAGVDDCRLAYDWLLSHGPKGEKDVSSLFVAGDSAGGNLTLSLLAWARDTGRRSADAAVALSPVTDARFVSPSIKDNLDKDVMLKPLASRMAKIPRFMISVAARLMSKHSTTDPVVSPLLGDLSGLPPILVLASDHEILRDDGRRYVNKAKAAGTDATFLCWKNMPHVWPIFYPDLPEAHQAFEQIEGFVKTHS